MRKGALAGAAAAFLITALTIASELYALSPRGTPLEIHATLLAIGLLMLCLAALPLACILLAPRPTRRFAGAAAAFCAAYLVVAIAGVIVTEKVRVRAFGVIEGRSAPLVAAIHAFENEHGRPPAALQELVPRYLRAVPGTGMGAYPHYHYSARRGDAWSLHVDASTGPFDWSTFAYDPGRRTWTYVPGD